MIRKLIIALLVVLFISANAFGQVYKFRAKEVAYKTKTDSGGWTEWSEWEDCNILTVINLDKDLFTIYSKETQEFDIIKKYPKEFDAEGVEIFKFLVVDQDGLRCNIRQRFVKSEYFHSQLYVDYADFLFVYNLVSN